MWSNIKCGFLAIRALATDTALTEVIKPPILRRANKNLWTIWSKLPNKSGRPFGKIFRFGAVGRFSFLTFSSSALHMAQNLLTVLLLTGRLFDPNFFATAAGPLMAGYFPIVNLSWLDHFRCGFRFSLFELETAETATSKSRTPRPDSSCKSCDGTMEENFMFKLHEKLLEPKDLFWISKEKVLLSVNCLSRSLLLLMCVSLESCYHDFVTLFEVSPLIFFKFLFTCIT